LDCYVGGGDADGEENARAKYGYESLSGEEMVGVEPRDPGRKAQAEQVNREHATPRSDFGFGI
jgi:hypothetical protein